MNILILFGLSYGWSISSFAEPVLDEVAVLKEWVSISSGTSDDAGVNRVQEAMARSLKRLGFEIEWIENPQKEVRSGKLLVATRKGASNSFITLVGHADTVFEKLNSFELSKDGAKAMGSGVSDNKGGLVVGLSALTRFFAKENSHASIRFVVSPSEETGSDGFHEKMQSISKESKVVLGLEPALENGSMVSARKGVRWYRIEVQGKEAHAGVRHEEGINACRELAILLAQLEKLTDYKKGTTVSIGHIEGGKDKYNIVCGQALAKVDARFANRDEARRLFSKIDRILSVSSVKSAKSSEKAKITVSNPVDYPPFSVSKESMPYIKKYLSIVEALESKKIQAEVSGGAADLNYMDRPGLVILDGLGPIGGGYHTSDEYVVVSSLKTRSQALEQLLIELDNVLR